MSQREAHLVKEQEAKRNGAVKSKPKLRNPKSKDKSFFLQWKEAIDSIDLKGSPGIKQAKEGSEYA